MVRNKRPRTQTKSVDSRITDRFIREEKRALYDQDFADKFARDTAYKHAVRRGVQKAKDYIFAMENRIITKLTERSVHSHQNQY